MGLDDLASSVWSSSSAESTLERHTLPPQPAPGPAVRPTSAPAANPPAHDGVSPAARPPPPLRHQGAHWRRVAAWAGADSASAAAPAQLLPCQPEGLLAEQQQQHMPAERPPSAASYCSSLTGLTQAPAPTSAAAAPGGRSAPPASAGSRRPPAADSPLPLQLQLSRPWTPQLEGVSVEVLPDTRAASTAGTGPATHLQQQLASALAAQARAGSMCSCRFLEHALAEKCSQVTTAV